MSFTGHIQDGQVVLDAPAPLPNRTEVTFTPSDDGELPPSPVINPRTGRPYPSYISRDVAEKLRSQESGAMVEEGP